jgi:predicted Rossmann fold flavoprotein
MSTPPPVTIVGAGAAGLIAAWRAASCGASAVVIERNRKPGIKLLISGGGKCNITHAGSMEALRNAFLQREARFLKPAFHRFSNTDVVRLLEEEGVKTVVREDDRIFPHSGRAEDVVAGFLGRITRAGASIECGTRVGGVEVRDGRVTGIALDGGIRPATHVVLATGGVSYPKTGTTGDGLHWARSLGHTIVPLRPALAPIAVTPRLPAEWRGVAVRGGMLAVYARGSKQEEFRGDILFTHEGISGPAALEVSRTAARCSEQGRADLRLDLLPDRDFPALDAELNAMIQSRRERMIATHLEAWLPNRLVPHVLALAGVDPGKRGHVVTREERRAIVRVVKSWRLGDVAGVPIGRGEVTAGGVSLDEVDPRSMRSRKIHGLYLCGEMLDIAGPVGGFNLQAAFSTGCVAGETAATEWLLEYPPCPRAEHS